MFGFIADMVAAREATTKLFKRAKRCPCCGSHDYLTHRARVQCAYCRVPVVDQPQRANPYTDPVQRANWERLQAKRLNSYNQIL